MDEIQKTIVKIIGKDSWWDHEKRVFRKKRLNLDKIPLRFRCPLCGAVVVPPNERKKSRREISDKWAIRSHNRKALTVYFKRDNPPQEEFMAWHERILMEHSDEFKDHVYVEYFEEPFTLKWNQAFFGVYVCNKCVRNRPNQHISKRGSEDITEKHPKPKKKTGVWINGYYKLIDQVIIVKEKDNK